MGLAAAEVGLKIDDRRRVRVSPDPSDRPIEQLTQPLGQEGAAKELARVAVFAADVGEFAEGDRVRVAASTGRKVAGGDVLVERDVAPVSPDRPGSVTSWALAIRLVSACWTRWSADPPDGIA